MFVAENDDGGEARVAANIVRLKLSYVYWAYTASIIYSYNHLCPIYIV